MKKEYLAKIIANDNEGIQLISACCSGDLQLTLELIAIDFLKNKDDYEIILIFKDNAYISLITETIEVTLEDQSEIK